MGKLVIPAGEDTPSVYLSKEENKFEIAGKSMPEDVAQFYKPIIAWVEDYASAPNAKTTVDFKMLYFNTASSKMLLDFMIKFEEMYEDGKDVLIRWYFPEDDEDMEEAGEEYSEMVEVPFEQISY